MVAAGSEPDLETPPGSIKSDEASAHSLRDWLGGGVAAAAALCALFHAWTSAPLTGACPDPIPRLILAEARQAAVGAEPEAGLEIPPGRLGQPARRG